MSSVGFGFVFRRATAPTPAESPDETPTSCTSRARLAILSPPNAQRDADVLNKENELEQSGAQRHGVEGRTDHGVSRLSTFEHRWSALLRQMRSTTAHGSVRRRPADRI